MLFWSAASVHHKKVLVLKEFESLGLGLDLENKVLVLVLKKVLITSLPFLHIFMGVRTSQPHDLRP